MGNASVSSFCEPGRVTVVAPREQFAAGELLDRFAEGDEGVPERDVAVLEPVADLTVARDVEQRPRRRVQKFLRTRHGRGVEGDGRVVPRPGERGVGTPLAMTFPCPFGATEYAFLPQSEARECPLQTK